MDPMPKPKLLALVVQIFPARYGQISKHLLVLTRAVYLYLQFVSVRHTILISLPALKAFLRQKGQFIILPQQISLKKMRIGQHHTPPKNGNRISRHQHVLQQYRQNFGLWSPGFAIPWIYTGILRSMTFSFI